MKIAIEGQVCAGKTTLCNNLINVYGESRICVIPDYSDFAGGGKNLPNALPETFDQQIEALIFFASLEVARFQQYLLDTELCIIDRSVHTLLAHCNAIASHYDQDILHRGKALLNEAREMVWPDLILYLDVPHQTIVKRNHGKFAEGSIFIKEDFNWKFREYFIPKLKCNMSTPLVVIDGALVPNVVCMHACKEIETALT